MPGTPARPARNRYRVAEAKAQLADKLGGADLEIETDDGTVFTVAHPMFRSPQEKAALQPLDDGDSEGIARVVLGTQYDDYVRHGGDPDDLLFVFVAVGQDTSDTLAGRKRPTRS